MAGKKNTTTRGGKPGTKPEDGEEEEEVEEVDAQRVAEDRPDDANDDGNADAEEDEEEGEGDEIEDRDDGGATAGRIPRDAAVVRDILKSMVRVAGRSIASSE